MSMKSIAMVSVIVVLGATGCISTPGAQRVALDAVDTLDQVDAAGDPVVTEDQKDCMREVILDYRDEELQSMGDRAADGDADAVEELTVFEARLRACRR
jgi:hypothetical protein